MQKDARQEEPLTLEIQDVMKHLISAIRIVKIYPPNNSIYTQSLQKAFEALTQHLQNSPDYHMGVQKTYFTYQQTPVGKDAQLNRSIALDLFSKGVREIIFSEDMGESEFQDLCLTLAMSSEDIAMKSGISTILWEKGITHIRVTEAGLDEVITTKTDAGVAVDGAAGPLREGQQPAEKKAGISGKTLVLSDVKTDPEGFGAGMLEFAIKTRAPHESVEERLYTLYQQAGKKIQKDHAGESEVMFEGLAKSALALKPPYRETFIAGKLYGDLDSDTASEMGEEQLVPNSLHEIRAGRYADVWTLQQVTVLLKRSAAKKIVVPAAPPAAKDLQPVPLPDDIAAIARDLENDTPEAMEAMKAISSAGMESDIMEAAVRTLISLLPIVKDNRLPKSREKELELFSGVLQQLESILSYLLKNNNYELATTIIKALHSPVDPEFQPRVREALKKTATKSIVKSTIADMQKYGKSSPEYLAAYSYLSNLEQKATEVLLDLLAEESNRDTRIFLLELMKDFGKDQFALLSEHLNDERWYVVRNIVSILAESKNEQAIALLRKAADHKNIQIRQEVVKALIAAGGKKAASVLARFLDDPDPDLQMTAINGYTEMSGLGPDDARPFMEFLEGRRLKKKEQQATVAAIRSLGKLGGSVAALFLHRYTRIRWWKSHKLQKELRDAAVRSIDAITRRQADGGRTK